MEDWKEEKKLDARKKKIRGIKVGQGSYIEQDGYTSQVEEGRKGGRMTDTGKEA